MKNQTDEIWRLLHADHEAQSDYRGTARDELVALIDRPPTRVIELGCGTGETGALIKSRFPGATVLGIEPHRRAAAQAATRIDRVLTARFEDVEFAREGIAPGSVDLVIAADVLEHMYNPWQALRSLHPLLTADATIIASLPNVRNLALLEQLAVHGRWRYAPYGLLDATHLRFFTAHEMRAMFAEGGYRVRLFAFKLDPALRDVYKANKGTDSVTLVRGRLRLENISQEELKELCSIQIFLVASPLDGVTATASTASTA